MSVALDERRQLCSLFEEVGPDVPTLCEGWTTRDLAAHLAVRERRPDAAPGILFAPLADYSERIRTQYAAKPWPELVALVAHRPVYLPDPVDSLMNTAEYFTHHEDVRRAATGWQARPADGARDAALWKTLGLLAKMAYRGCPVGVTLRRGDGTELAAHRGPRTVTVHGDPGELILHCSGREQSSVTFDGEAEAIAVVQGVDRGI